MISYLLNSGLLLALLLVFYKLLLEKEKLHRFNRGFLLFSLIFGLSVPFISFDLNYDISGLGIKEGIPQSIENISEPINLVVSKLGPITDSQLDPDSFSYFRVIWGIYILGAIIFGFRMLKSLLKIFFSVKSANVVAHKTGRLVLLAEDITPHTFLSSIFLNEEKYRRGDIPDEILAHEMSHVKGKHSLDVLFIELLKIVFWFNPVFYFYKSSIQLNHEFLADEVIIKNSKNISFYQKLLIDHTQQLQAISLTSNFNYSLTKKRLIMMTKKTSRAQTMFRKLCFIPILALSVLAFSDISYAQSIQQATVSELINELSSKVKAQNEFSDQEKSDLDKLITELRKKTNLIAPPQLKEVFIGEEIDDLIKKTAQKYIEAIHLYMKVPAKPENRAKLQTTYDNAMVFYHEHVKAIAQKKGDEEKLPPPPMPANPELRLKKH